MRLTLFIAIVQSILFLGHGVFYKTVVRFFGVASPGKLLLLRCGLGLLSVSFIPVSFLAFRHSGVWVRWLYTASASWLGILYLLFLASILCWILHGAAVFFHLPIDRRVLLGCLIGIALTASLYGFINAGRIRVTAVEIQFPRLPDPWKNRRAVWVSDTHLGQVRSEAFARRIATLIRGLHPDIVFLGGDVFDGVRADRKAAIEPFSTITAPLGVYFITGNHEEFSDNTPYLHAVKTAGIQVLHNEMIELDGVQIIGVGYRDSRDESAFRSVLQRLRIDRRKTSLLLKHAPLHLEVAREQGISLQLSGHTHRGQVFLFRFITSRVYQGFDYGLNWFGDLPVYTSSGAGTWGPPMRLDTNPEVVVVTFK
jgi:predicted MPP superfamily phosphohydrolase